MWVFIVMAAGLTVDGKDYTNPLLQGRRHFLL